MNNKPSIRDLVSWGEKKLINSKVFFGHGTDNAWDESLSLVLFALGLDYSLCEQDLDRAISQTKLDQVQALINQRCDTRAPAPYLTKRIWFAGIELYIDDRVLIPRSPIAELIVAGFYPWFDSAVVEHKSPIKILDLCTGSGCIAIACALAMENAQITATDLSSSALEVAYINVEKYALEKRVTLVQSDVYQALPEMRYDLIISNPPYVSDQEMATLPIEYNFEPALGLRSDNNGLDIVHKIIDRAADYLTEKGVLIVEVGNSDKAVQKEFTRLPFVWIEFANGGHGVFTLTREQLLLDNE